MKITIEMTPEETSMLISELMKGQTNMANNMVNVFTEQMMKQVMSYNPLTTSKKTS